MNSLWLIALLFPFGIGEQVQIVQSDIPTAEHATKHFIVQH